VNTKELKNFYKGKTVLITGHTGFKGSWLSHTLLEFGAKVIGVSLAPNTPNDIFVVTNLEEKVKHYEFDIRDDEAVRKLMKEEMPDVVFHLAAQPLVRRSYSEPLLTVTTNVIGTANVLEAIRFTPSVRSVVVITTDKVYKDEDSIEGYKEDDKLGGYDPYSGSKAAADIITQAYTKSFFNIKDYGNKHQTLVAIARAGNVIGGGDWSEDRLVPSIMHEVLNGDGKIVLRAPKAVRPWEHVLEPISGYLLLGMQLGQGEASVSDAWNFGPDKASWLTVEDVAKHLCTLLGKGTIKILADKDKHETNLLTLDTAKANHDLGWVSQWDSDRTLKETSRWYTAVNEDRNSASKVTKEQIAEYFNLSK
tara:strand:- start:8856 stop:9947 length:1092 start_codon:yes stop_codon:yes gene_type:complete